LVLGDGQRQRADHGERAGHGLQERRLEGRPLFVLPSTSPANAAVPFDEKLRWFRELRTLADQNWK
jgi:G:T/U-mismatch repair DNA glycosylase